MTLVDGWRLASGTLTAIPISGPSRVDRRTTAAAMLLAPLAMLPLGLAVVVIGSLALWLDVPAPVAGVLVVAFLAWATRALHWDGLSDVADGLTASLDAERSLAVMKTGTSGPAGTLAVVLVVGLQALGFASLLDSREGIVLAGVLVVISRCALAVTCSTMFPPARTDGLGHVFAGNLPRVAAVVSWMVAALVVSATCLATGLDVVRPLVACAAALVVVTLVAQHTARRFGGVTGDVYGAAVEAALATLLVVAA